MMALSSIAFSVLGLVIAAFAVLTMPKKYDAAYGEWQSAPGPLHKSIHRIGLVLLAIGVALAFIAYAKENFT